MLIQVTDAGFRAPWFRAVRRLRWDWIGRVRGRTLVRPQVAEHSFELWIPCRKLYRRVREAARGLVCGNIVRELRADEKRGILRDGGTIRLNCWVPALETPSPLLYK